MHDHFQQSLWFYIIQDNVSCLEFAKLDVSPKKLDFALEKAVKIKVNVRTWSLCKSRWFCKLLDFVKNNPDVQTQWLKNCILNFHCFVFTFVMCHRRWALVILSIPFYLEHITSCSISKNLELVPFQFKGLTIETSSILFLYNNWNSGL